jgi:radical SAM superfamily enzyme YgiQ (UPF0313 family)
LNLQYSRGCPYNCEFCEITFLDGNIPRTKDRLQVIIELDAIYNAGWRGSIFIVDDNFIGNKNKLKADILTSIIRWQEERNYPFQFLTEVSINLVDDEDLIYFMTRAGFSSVFIGIETPNETSLTECDKTQNTGRDLLAAVKYLQNHGLEVMAGFIIGFDNDTDSIFNTQVNFIQKSGITTAMVGLLNAPKGTRLYQRLKHENRLLDESFTGDNMDGSINFKPNMDREILVNGYSYVLSTLYSPKQYYERISLFLDEYKPKLKRGLSKLTFSHLIAFLKCIWLVGIRENGRRYFWKLYYSTLFGRPRLFTRFITLTVYGYHFRKVISNNIEILDNIAAA